MLLISHSSASKAINASDGLESPVSYEDFVNESLRKSSQQQFDRECDKNKHKVDFEGENAKCDLKLFKNSQKESESSESESEIDLTTTASARDFVLVNGCIDFSNNNNNK